MIRLYFNFDWNDGILRKNICMYNIKHMYTINFKHPQVFKTPNLPFHSLFDKLTEIHYVFLFIYIIP